MISELFYSHILSMNRGSFIQEVSSGYTSPFSDTDELSKNRFTGRKSFQGFRETGPWPEEEGRGGVRREE